jgi:hypothetical protein
MSRKKKNKVLPLEQFIYDEEFQMSEYEERQRIIDMLNEGDTVKPEEVRCAPGNHYILINEFGVPECATCLTLYTWKGVRRELFATNWMDEQVIERYKELKHVAKRVINGKPPKNIVNWNDYRYLTGFGYQYIERWFYERD